MKKILTKSGSLFLAFLMLISIVGGMNITALAKSSVHEIAPNDVINENIGSSDETHIFNYVNTFPEGASRVRVKITSTKPLVIYAEDEVDKHYTSDNKFDGYFLINEHKTKSFIIKSDTAKNGSKADIDYTISLVDATPTVSIEKYWFVRDKLSLKLTGNGFTSFKIDYSANKDMSESETVYANNDAEIILEAGKAHYINACVYYKNKYGEFFFKKWNAPKEFSAKNRALLPTDSEKACIAEYKGTFTNRNEKVLVKFESYAENTDRATYLIVLNSTSKKTSLTNPDLGVNVSTKSKKKILVSTKNKKSLVFTYTPALTASQKFSNFNYCVTVYEVTPYARNVTARRQNSSLFTYKIKWKAPVKSDIKAHTGYYVQLSETEDFKDATETKIRSGLYRNIKIEDPRKAYYVRVVTVRKYKKNGKYVTDKFIPNSYKKIEKALVPTEITKLTSKKTSIRVYYNKVKKAKYEIQYSTDPSMNDPAVTKTVTTSSASKTINKLKKGTAYYVRVRTFAERNGKIYRTAWSEIKSITTKK